MKTVEIDIDFTPTTKALEEEFRVHNLQRGDRLRLLSSKIDDSELITLAIVIVAILAINNWLNKDKIAYANFLLEKVFDNKDIKEIETEIKKEYEIDLAIDPKKDEEYDLWRQYSQSNLLKAYDHSEPEYDISMVKEPNPNYKK